MYRFLFPLVLILAISSAYNNYAIVFSVSALLSFFSLLFSSFLLAFLLSYSTWNFTSVVKLNTY